jgi:histidine triad (HIT) family protein
MDVENCIFCKIARGELPAPIVYQDDELMAFRDIAPVAPTHILIIPRAHIGSAAQINDQNALVAGKMIALAARIADAENVAESGYRLVTNIGRQGGQSIFHFHFHLLAGRYMSWPPG